MPFTITPELYCSKMCLEILITRIGSIVASVSTLYTDQKERIKKWITKWKTYQPRASTRQRQLYIHYHPICKKENWLQKSGRVRIKTIFQYTVIKFKLRR